jgi:hypothetical protein
MGREIMHVPLDFDWPLKEVWSGYIMPDLRDCPDCRAGYSQAYELMYRHIGSLMWDLDALRQSPEYREITRFLCGRDARLSLLGHDSMDAWEAVRTLGRLSGLPEGWETCKTCNGSGIHPDDQEEYDNWELTPPPEGEGWQVWETVSEGSPISPVLDSKEGVVRWLLKQNYSIEAARRFVETEWAPSAMFVISDEGNRFASDIESLVR